jgi:hypothetical protein
MVHRRPPAARARKSLHSVDVALTEWVPLTEAESQPWETHSLWAGCVDCASSLARQDKGTMEPSTELCNFGQGGPHLQRCMLGQPTWFSANHQGAPWANSTVCVSRIWTLGRLPLNLITFKSSQEPHRDVNIPVL